MARRAIKINILDDFAHKVENVELKFGSCERT